MALVLRLVHLWQIRQAPFFAVLMGDSRAYDAWAQQIAAGDWLGHQVFYQAPLYPYFLGLLYAMLGRDRLIVVIVQAVLGSVSCVLLGLAGRRLFSPSAGIVAGLMLAVYAPAIFFDGLVQKSVLDVFFLCLALLILSGLLTTTHARPRSWFALGLALAGLSLTRENALVLVATLLVWTLGRRRVPRHERVAAAGVFLAGLAVVLGPVAVRNAVMGGGFSLTTSQLGPNLYIGNNPRADGTYMPLRPGRGAPEYERQDATELAERAAGRPLTPSEVSGYWTGRALAFIRAQPGAWLRLLGRKAALLGNASEMLDTESQESYAEWSLPLRLASPLGHFGVLLPLAVLGLVVSWPQRDRLWVLYAMLVAYAASVVMFYVFARYRHPLVPLLVLFAAAGLAGAAAFLRGGSRRRTVATLAVVAVVAMATNRPLLSADRMRAITETNLGVALQEEGRLDNAVAAYQRALAIAPEQVEAHYNLANALLAQGRPAEAIPHLRRVLLANPGSVEARNTLGIALASSGDLEAAISELREALRLDPDSARTHRNLGDALASRGRREEALLHLRRAAELDPGDASGRYDLATALLEAGRLDEAIVQLRATLALNPGSAEAHNNLGIALGSQGRLDEAVEQFQEALKTRPAFEEASRNLALAEHARASAKRSRGRPAP